MPLWQELSRPFRPPIQTARNYSLLKLRRDLVAGLTVSVVEVPQAMAYALIAGVPPQYGLYTSIIQGVIGALLSSSEHMTTGPTNTQSLLIASAVSRLTTDPEHYLHLVFGLTLLKGLIQLAFALARMGSMIRYVSKSVIVGLAAGAGVLIVLGQAPHLLGLKVERTAHDWPGAIGAVQRLWPHLRQVNISAIVIGLGTVAVVLAGRRISRFFPGAIVAIAIASILAYLLHWDASLLLLGYLKPTLPHFFVPPIGWSEAESLFGGALALALIGLLESVAIAKSIASHTGERIDANQEFFTQGFKNFVSSFFQCIPGSGSFTRSALDHAAGAQTRFAAVFNALFVAVIFYTAGAQARWIPLASLAGVLMVIAVGLLDWRYFWRVARTDRSDAAVCLITFAATLATPLEYAIFIGIFLSLALYLRKASQLHLAEMIRAPGAGFVERPLNDRTGARRVMFLQVEGDLFFAVADQLEDYLSNLARGGVRVVILRLRRTHSIDSTVLALFERFVLQMRQRNAHVILCGIRPEVMRTLKRFGLVDLVGRDNLFEPGFGVFAGAKRALERARDLIGSSIDTDGFVVDDEPDDSAGSYAI